MFESINRIQYSLGEPWVLAVILLCMSLLAYVHNMYPSRFDKLFRATFNERITRQVMREEMVFSHRASWLLLIVSASAVSLVIYLVWQNISGADSQFGHYVFILSMVSAWVIIRQIIRGLFGLLAEREFGLKEFNFVSALVYKVLGLIMLPLTVLMAFTSNYVAGILKYIVLITLFVAMIYRLIRGWKIGRHYVSSTYYMIAYLCALELIPTLVVIKAVMSNVPI